MIKGFKKACLATYDVAAFLAQSVRHIAYPFRKSKLLFKQFYEVGNRSLFIVTLFGLFVGLILVLYGGELLGRVKQEQFIGLMGLAIVWEFGPVFTAFILTGRIGAAYAAEIGTMRVYDEIDALQVMGVRPEAYLASPRLVACALLTPVLVIYADFVAILGGAATAWVQMKVPPGTFFDMFINNLHFQEMTRSLIKAVVFGVIIATTGCYHGFRTTGGAEGVGRSTTESVVHSLLAILMADYLLSKILMPEFNV